MEEVLYPLSEISRYVNSKSELLRSPEALLPRFVAFLTGLKQNRFWLVLSTETEKKESKNKPKKKVLAAPIIIVSIY